MMKFRLLALCAAAVLLAAFAVDDRATGLTNEDITINSPLEDSQPEPIIASIQTKPAKISFFRLKELGIPLDSFITAGQGNLDDGTPEYLIDKGHLFIGSPSDIGSNQIFTLNLNDENGQASEITLTVKTLRHSEISTHYHSSGEDDGYVVEESPPLLISGLGHLNALGGQDLVFSVDIDKTITPEYSSITIATNSTGTFQTFDIKDNFTFDPAINQFSISKDDLNAVLDSIPSGSFSFSINLVSDDHEFAELYSFTSLKAQASLTGQIVDADWFPLSGTRIDDLNVAIVGTESRTRQVVEVDED